MAIDMPGQDEEKAPPQVTPDRPGPELGPDEDTPPSDQPPGRPQHPPANPDDE